MKKFLLLVPLCGCTSAGPFVTNISTDGHGNLIIEKNMVHLNAFMGTVSAGDAPVVSTLRIFDPAPTSAPAQNSTK